MNLLVVYTKDIHTDKDMKHIYDVVRNKVSLKFDVIVLPTEYVDSLEFYTNDNLIVTNRKEGILVKHKVKS